MYGGEVYSYSDKEIVSRRGTLYTVGQCIRLMYERMRGEPYSKVE